MLRLAVSTTAETFERIREPLADRGIEIGHLQAKERAIHLTDREPADQFDVGFVFPGRLMEASAIDALHKLSWVNSREDVFTSRNKGGVIAALDSADLPVPETVMVSNPVDESVVSQAVDDLSFPVVIKPNSATRGVGVAKAADMDSLLGIVDYLNLIHDYRATGDKSYLIQEYLPDARDYRVMVVDGDCVGGVERRLPESLGEGGGNTTSTAARKQPASRCLPSTVGWPKGWLRSLGFRISVSTFWRPAIGWSSTKPMLDRRSTRQRSTTTAFMIGWLNSSNGQILRQIHNWVSTYPIQSEAGSFRQKLHRTVRNLWCSV